MKLLVVNAGSSSIKYQLFDMENETLLAKGNAQRIGLEGGLLEHKVNGKLTTIEKDMPNHSQAMELILNTLVNEEIGVITSLTEISGFGHRIVSGGPKYFDPTLVTEEVLNDLKGFTEFAPLHMPANVMGIEACMQVAPGVPNVAVFDTGFYKNLPEKSFVYAIPYKYYKDYNIRRFGYHGISHDYVSNEVARVLSKKREDLKIITCHLGNGASISAIDKGVCVDTSMGFTPLEGIMMGSRSGDIDPAIVAFLAQKLNVTADEVVTILNKQSGLLGVSEISTDIRDIIAQMETNPKAKLAIDIFIHKIKKYIGAYSAVMGGVDAIVFTAGTGENRAEIREFIMQNFEYLGVDFDFEANRNFERGKICKISKDSSKVAVYVIPTDEELMIAKASVKFVK